MSRLTRDGIDCRTRLAKPNSQARTRTGNINFPCSADHEEDWQPYPVDPYSCYMCDHNIGEKPTVIRYTHINRYAGTPESHLNVMIFFSLTGVLSYDSITVSSTWELTSVSMRYSLGDAVNTSLSRLVYCTHV